MEKKQSQHIILGMLRDLSISKFSPLFSYENKNIRIDAREKETLLSVTNERGNELRDFREEDTREESFIFNGIYLGSAQINNYIVIFAKSTSTTLPDFIYRFNMDTLEYKVIYLGDLGFSVNDPIECLPVFENELILKVYWVDGINLLRMINIVSPDDVRDTWNDNSFDAIRTIENFPNVTILRLEGGGLFPASTILYAFTLYSLYGQESNIFYMSPIYYASYSDRGASPEDTVGCVFNILISNITADNRFDYIRIYQIQRTTLDAVPTVKIVTDVAIVAGLNITYIDTNTTGSTIDPTTLLYIGGEEVIPYTLSQKDNTLFLGNYYLNRKLISQEAKDALQTASITSAINSSSLLVLSTSGSIDTLYPYNNLLKYSLDTITSFKWDETYRIGLLFQYKTGKLSEVIFLDDYTVTTLPSLSTNQILPVVINVTLGTSTLAGLSELASLGYKRVRLVVVYPSYNDRTIICLGVVNPTVYNVADRATNSPYAQSSWFFRPMPPVAITESVSANYNPLGNYVEFRHNTSLPGGIPNRSCELSFGANWGDTVYSTSTDTDLEESINRRSSYYYVDSNVVTMHSPDIEFDDTLLNIDLSNLQFRLVGYVEIGSTSTDISLTTSTATRNPNAIGFYKGKLGSNTRVTLGSRGLVSGVFYIDLSDASIISSTVENRGWLINPWHKEGALQNNTQSDIGGEDPLRGTFSKLQYKKISNLRVAQSTRMFTNVWSPSNGITAAQVISSNEELTFRIKLPINSDITSNIGDLNYKPNIDKVLTYAGLSSGYLTIVTADPVTDPVSAFKANLNYSGIIGAPISMKYKSGIHAVFAFNYDSNGNPIILPYHNINAPFLPTIASNKPFWFTSDPSALPTLLNWYGSFPSNYGTLYLGELYRLNVPNRFGGTTEEALAENIWYPASDWVSFTGTSSVTLMANRGDTFLLRYDSLKTYPFTLEDTNSIVDILSFICETRINIDGRYDRNRGLTSNLVTTPTIYNLFNDVYTLKDNFISNRTSNSNLLNLDNFLNTITWTGEKFFGELTDTWTNITAINNLDMDGERGLVQALRRYNNEIFCFLDTAISQVLFNSRVQIPITDGLPVEISNSYKVDGKRYIEYKTGTTNKWSICETPEGLYFVDGITSGIYIFNGKAECISDALGFRTWVGDNVTTDRWVPINPVGFKTSYDKISDDIYFTNKDWCLCYSSYLKLFTSFFSYERSYEMFNNDGKYYMIYPTDQITNQRYSIYELFVGDYGRYQNVIQPSYIHIIANPEIVLDKVFDNIEMRADVVDLNLNYQPNELPFNKLTIWNEYQSGTLTLNWNNLKPSNFKKKFRVWRTIVPRDSSNGRDRIRNPWVNIKFERDNASINRLTLHDIVVNYYV